MNIILLSFLLLKKKKKVIKITLNSRTKRGINFNSFNSQRLLVMDFTLFIELIRAHDALNDLFSSLYYIDLTIFFFFLLYQNFDQTISSLANIYRI